MFVEIIPGILEKDYQEIENKLRKLSSYVSWAHLDMADNTFVPNTLLNDYDRLTAILRSDYAKRLAIEVHVMALNPVKYIKPLADAGVKRLIAHVESNDPRDFLEQAKFESIEAGLAIDGPTEIEQIEPFLDEIDFVHVMTIESGFSGQPFMPEAVDKIRLIRENYSDLPISVDGGINDHTARIVREAGASRIIATSFFWDHAGDIPSALKLLQGSK